MTTIGWDEVGVAWDDPDYSWDGEFQPVPPVPPPLELATTGVLGRSHSYNAYIADRSGRFIHAELPFTDLTWERVISATSTASVSLAGVSGEETSACCAMLDNADAWANELHIYRNAERVWAGPITSMQLGEDEVIVRAEDVSAWLGERNLHQDHNYEDTDLAEVFAYYVIDAMSVDNVPGIRVEVGRSVIYGNRKARAANRPNARAALDELARTGVAWSVIDRTMLVYGSRPIREPVAIVDEHIEGRPTVDVSGSMATDIVVLGEGRSHDGPQVAGRWGNSSFVERYGVHEKVFREDRVGDNRSATLAARRRWGRMRRPPVLFRQADLSPSFPLEVNEITPDLPVDADLRSQCRTVRGRYRVTKVTGTFSAETDSIAIDVQPPGDDADA